MHGIVWAFRICTGRGMVEMTYGDFDPGAKALVGAWLCRRLEDGTVMWRRITETSRPSHRHRLRLQTRPEAQMAFFRSHRCYCLL